MPNKEDLINAYTAALEDHAKNTAFVMFKAPNEYRKTVEGRLTEYNGYFYVKTPSEFYLVFGNEKIQEIFNKDQNIEFNFTDENPKLNGIKVGATLIE